MGFQTFIRPTASNAGTTSRPTIGVDKRGFITISTTAHRLLGEPAAVTVEWDPDEYLIRLTGAAPDDLGAFKTGGKSTAKRFLGTSFLAHAGLGIPAKGMRFPAERHGTRSIIADLSDLPAPASKVTPMRRTA